MVDGGRLVDETNPKEPHGAEPPAPAPGVEHVARIGSGSSEPKSEDHESKSEEGAAS
jgi:hypothetical protein